MRPAKHEAHLGSQGEEVSEFMPFRKVGGKDLWSPAVDDGNERQIKFGSVLPLEGEGCSILNGDRTSTCGFIRCLSLATQN